MRQSRNINIIVDAGGNRLVLINDILFKGKVEETKKEKHDKDAKHGWYRYDVRFAIPVYENDVLIRYNVFRARLLINHAQNGKKYLYDILTIKKEKATTISVVKTHFLPKIVARSSFVVKNYEKI